MICKTEPFLPIYDFDALEAEPDPVPSVPEALPAPKSLLECIMQSRIVFDPVQYGVITISNPDNCGFGLWEFPSINKDEK